LATGCFAHLPFLILNYLAWHLSIIDTLPDRRFQDFYVFIFGRNALHNTLIYDPEKRSAAPCGAPALRGSAPRHVQKKLDFAEEEL
jgi:hypothetical protein